MSDAPAIALGVVLVAVVAALAAGGGSSGEATSSASDTPAAPGASSAGPCTGLDTVTSGDGSTYAQYPVSSSNSLGCTLRPGDRGETVAALQRALALCKHKQVKADGVYGSQTSSAVAALGGADGRYGPPVAKTMTWPWFSASTRSFTGRCSEATTST
jgi:peptidoglycan hydrolase-like protein with peptidoglycan-binding domain